ncbi:MAG: LysR family transcriptional regulator [Roseibium sp.]|uniref:LysR family transcriptional regulator n=1 Tax=Roseibium sp. TaxID=1936156 RepID=UPI00261EE707|nr:LysR family transcriptional regulator [Roseibium sp.]MCV0425087.1 LysR family transcriptional regulator [Roseibium sp.]
MTRRLDIDSLRALQTIAACGGVTRAAEKLSLSQSAVSHKIKRLETSTDCPLLNRRPGAALLTEDGLRLVQYANRILALHDEALAALGKNKMTGKIRLGITEDTTSDGLAAILGRFSRQFPEVAVRTHVSQSLVLQKEIEDRTIDLAVMQIFSEDVRADDLLLYENELCWVKAIDFELPTEAPVPFLSYDDNCFYRHWMLEHGSTCGHRFNTVLQCTSRTGIVAAVEAGLGVTILNRRHISSAMEIIEGDFPTPPRISYIVRQSRHAKSNSVSALANEIARETKDIALLRVA